MALVTPDYAAPAWCPGGHWQTVLPARLFKKPEVTYRREHVEWPDGDVLLWDWATPEPLDPKAPILVHFHGLEGSSESHYALSLMEAAAQRGWRGVVTHFRSCGGEMNRLPRSYHAGDTQEMEAILKVIKGRFPEAPLYVVGVSLGGNQLSLFLGERGEDARLVTAAVSVGAPVDLVVGSERMSKGVNVLYENMFLKTLREKLLIKAEAFPDLIDKNAIAQCQTMYDFDDIYTAPMHGFISAMDYWQKASAKRQLGGVRVPLLMLNAKNDPFFAAWALPRASEVSSYVTLDYPEEGGHVGFPLGPYPGSLSYLPDRVFRFFETGQ